MVYKRKSRAFYESVKAQGKKYCPNCEQVLDTSAFSVNNSKKDGLEQRCKKCNNKRTKKQYQEASPEQHQRRIKGNREWQKARRDELVAISDEYKLTHGCSICGYNKCAGAMDYHHVEDKQKEPARLLQGARSLPTINEELSKCVLLCSNCHREHHAGHLDLPHDLPRVQLCESTESVSETSTPTKMSN